MAFYSVDADQDQAPPGLLRQYLLIWFITGCVVFSLMLTHSSDDGTVLGRYTQRYVFLLIMMFGLVLLSGFGYLGHKRLATISLSQPYWRWVLVGLWPLVIGGVWFLLDQVLSVAPAVLLFEVYVCFSLIAVGLWFVRLTHLKEIRAGFLPAVLLAGLVSVVIIAFIGYYPPSRYIDEPMEVSWGQTAYQTGHLNEIGIFEFYNKADWSYGSLLHYPLGLWMELVGVGLLQARLFYLVVGLTCSIFIFSVAQQLYDNTAALVPVALIPFLVIAHNWVRPDVFVALSVSAGLYFFYSARTDGGLWRYFAAGLSLALAVEGHIYGLRYALAFGLFLTGEYIWLIFRRRQWQWNAGFWLFVAGGLTYGVIFFALRVFLASESFSLETALNVYTSVEQRSGYSSFIERSIAQLGQYWRAYWSSHPLEVTLIAFGLGAALWSKNRLQQQLAVIYLISWLVFALLLTHQNPFYWVHNLPFITLLTGGLIHRMRQKLRHTYSFADMFALHVLLALAVANLFVLANHRQHADELIAIAHEINDLIPADATVMGYETYYLGMPYRDQFTFSVSYVLASPIEWPTPPDVVIITPGLDDRLRGNEYNAVPWLYHFVEDQGLVKAYCFSHSLFNGLTEVYLSPAYGIDQSQFACDS